jgi:hypothetical protein
MNRLIIFNKNIIKSFCQTLTDASKTVCHELPVLFFVDG